MNALHRVENALTKVGLSDIILKPQQLQCFEYLLEGYDVIAVLPTGFGKSLLFQLLPDVLPTRASSNIVIVVCPLSSIIEDQLKVLKVMGVNASKLHSRKNSNDDINLFDDATIGDGDVFNNCEATDYSKSKIIFAHPEDLLSDVGRTLMKSDVFQNNVVACVIDEAHCVEIW